MSLLHLRMLAFSVMLGLPMVGFCTTEATATLEVPNDALQTAASSALKRLPREEVLAASTIVTGIDAPRRPARHQVKPVTVLDEIEVTARADPADFTRPQKAPMVQFREQLERSRPMTPAEMTCTALSIIGLCWQYGPDGAPPEDRSRTAGERNATRSTSELARQFRGTIQ